MKKITFLFALIFIAFIIFMLVKQNEREKKLFKETVYGKVISSKKARKGYYDLRIIQNNKLRGIAYTPGKPELKAAEGDSVYKDYNSSVFFIRKNEMTDFMRTDWKDCHISGKWEE